MIFNSFAFLVFFPVVFVLYWSLHTKLKFQNIFLLATSYFFYGWWDPRFLGLLFISSLCDFLIGRVLGSTEDRRFRKALLLASLAVNLGLLGFFKYYDFFITGFTDLLTGLGLQAHPSTLSIILPVGISFYTFQTLSYTIDIYRQQIQPTRDPVTFFAFVSFFPQLVAGPIERARDLLPQFAATRSFNHEKARDGLRQILWGFAKKIAIADTCAPIVNSIFAMDPAETDGITLFAGALLFAFQIYADFSGYSDIAIGTARLLGIHLTQNFAYPYFSRSVAEFWRRWHISLSTWFRDYVYIPLGGSRTSNNRVRNLMITFAVSGFWHGANWTFIGWGILHGLYHLPRLNAPRPTHLVSLKDLPAILGTFLLVTLAWVFFRAPSISAALEHIGFMFLNAAYAPGANLPAILRPEVILIPLMLAIEWRARESPHALSELPYPTVVRWSIYTVLTLVTLVNLNTSTVHEFIYFQF